MAISWSSPRTWTTGEIVTAAIMNAHLRDNLLWLAGTTGNISVPAVAASGLTGATAASRVVGGTASGAPVSGTFAVGDFVIDQTGKVWICTAAGTPGTWTLASGMTNPMSALGDSIYGGAAGAATRLPGNTTTTRKFWRQTGDGVNSAAPVWDTVVRTDIPFVGCRLTKSAAQSIANGTATQLTWDTEGYDTNAFHDGATNTERITVPASFAGKYRFTAGVTWTGAADTNIRSVNIWHSVKGYLVQSQVNNVGGGNAANLNVSVDVDMAVGEYCVVYVSQSSGAALNCGSSISTFFCAAFLGP